MANIFYNRIIRKLTVGFGNMFNDITLVRYNPDNSEAERFLVPIAYAAKEHYVQRLQDDYNLDKKVQMTLPRLSYEMTGLKYDASRKQNTNTRNFAQSNEGVIGQYNPVPYNLDFKLYLYVRNIEDGTQVIEHILPYFTPDYTIKLNMIPEMGIIKEVPIILNDITQDITYEGDRSSDPRLVIWTLSFTVKANFYGPVSTSKVITHSITSILNKIGPEDVVELQIDPTTGVGSYQLGETVYQGVNVNNAIASGTVIDWDATNLKLKLVSVDGNFISTEPLYGFVTNTNYKFTSYNLVPQKYAEIDVYATSNTDTIITTDTNLTVDHSGQPATIITENPQ
jgi:T4-like virus Myoviridae tail sheath stabiliser